MTLLTESVATQRFFLGHLEEEDPVTGGTVLPDSLKKETIIRAFDYLSQTPSFCPFDLKTSGKISSLLLPLIEQFDPSGATVESIDCDTTWAHLIKERLTINTLVQTSLDDEILLEIVRTAINFLNGHPKKPDGVVYQFNLGVKKDDKPTSGCRSMHLSISKGYVTRRDCIEYSRMDNTIHLDSSQISFRVKSWIESHRDCLPKSLQTAKDLLQFFGPLYTEFDPKARVRKAGFGIKGTSIFFVHSQLSLLDLRDITGAALENFLGSPLEHPAASKISHTFNIGANEFAKDEENLNIYSINVTNVVGCKKEPHKKLDELNKWVIAAAKKFGEPILKSDRVDLKAIQKLLTRILLTLDRKGKVVSPDDFILQTQMDPVILKRVLNSALHAIHLSEGFSFGYRVTVQTRHTAFGPDELFEHQIFLNQRECPGELPRHEMMELARILEGKKEKINFEPTSFESFEPFLSLIFRFIDKGANVLPVYLVEDQEQRAAYLQTKLSFEATLDTLRLLLQYRNLNLGRTLEPHLELVDEAVGEDGHKLFFISFYDAKTSKPFSYKEMVNNLEDKVRDYIARTSPSLVDFFYSKKVLKFIEEVTHSIFNESIRIKEASNGFLESFSVISHSHPKFLKAVVIKALKEICLDSSRPWGYEVSFDSSHVQGKNLFETTIQIKQKEGAKDTKTVLEFLDKMRHLLIEKPDLNNLPFSDSKNVIVYFNTIFKHLGLNLDIKRINPEKESKHIFEIVSDEDSPLITALISVALNSYKSHATAKKGVCNFTFDFNGNRPLVRKITPELLAQEKLFTTDDFPLCPVYKLTVDTSGDFADAQELGFDIIDPLHMGVYDET